MKLACLDLKFILMRYKFLLRKVGIDNDIFYDLVGILSLFGNKSNCNVHCHLITMNLV